MQERKEELAARYIYIGLAVVIAIAMTVAIFTAVNKRRNKEKLPDPPETEITAPDISVYPEETKAPQETEKKPIETVAPPETDKPDESAVVPVEPDLPDVPDEPVDVEPDTEKPTIVEREFSMPVRGSVMKGYSPDMPVFSLTMNDYRAHNGIDIHAELAEPVYAVTDGVIRAVYTDPMMGKTVMIDHGDGLYSVYQNLQSTLPDGIETGKAVAGGDVIGAVGETTLIECADQSHLHFAMKKGDVFCDPGEFIEGLKTPSLE